MGNFLKLAAFALFTLSTLLSCGDGLYQTAPEGVASARTRALLYVDHSETILFTGKGLKGARFNVTPDLPAGLTVDADLPGIVGAPTTAQVLTEYDVHVSSDFGQADFSLSIKVNLAAPSPENLADIFTGGASAPVILGNLGEEIVFAAESNVEGRELWKTDGTSGGTAIVRDIDNGVGLSSAPFPLTLAQNAYPFSDLIFFGAETAGGGIELYKTDGTTVGTVQVANLSPDKLAKGGSRIVFSGNDALGVGVEPFAADLADGGGVVNLADIAAGTDSSPEGFTELGSSVLFFASDQNILGKELYVTDGTPGGTTLVEDINPGAGDSPGTWAPIAYDGYVYFGADDGANGFELWRSDGTAAGTALFMDISVGATSSDPGNFVVFGGVLYFTADDNVNGLELWRTDGTLAGTYMVKDINPSSGATVTLFEKGAGDTFLYFSADDGVYGEELWRTDGTAAGTMLVKDIESGAGSGAPLHLTMVNGVLFFSATTAAYGRELWKSTGTSAGTVLAADLNSGVGDGIQPPASFFEYEGVLYFAGATAATDVELFKVTPY